MVNIIFWYAVTFETRVQQSTAKWIVCIEPFLLMWSVGSWWLAQRSSSIFGRSMHTLLTVSQTLILTAFKCPSSTQKNSLLLLAGWYLFFYETFPFCSLSLLTLLLCVSLIIILSILDNNAINRPGWFTQTTWTRVQSTIWYSVSSSSSISWNFWISFFVAGDPRNQLMEWNPSWWIIKTRSLVQVS